MRQEFLGVGDDLLENQDGVFPCIDESVFTPVPIRETLQNGESFGVEIAVHLLDIPFGRFGEATAKFVRGLLVHIDVEPHVRVLGGLNPKTQIVGAVVGI